MAVVTKIQGCPSNSKRENIKGTISTIHEESSITASLETLDPRSPTGKQGGPKALKEHSPQHTVWFSQVGGVFAQALLFTNKASVG